MEESLTPARPLLGLSMGDPGGVGPEVVVKALADPHVRRAARFRIYGAGAPLHDAAQRAGVDPFWWTIERGSSLLATAGGHDVVLVDHARGDERFGRAPGRLAGELSFRFVEDAIADALRPREDPLATDAVVTAPISKRAWAMAGRGKYPGHTELFATRCNARRVAMMFDSPQLRVILATAHVPLMDVRNTLTIGRVFDAIDLGHEACLRLGVLRPRIGVCGLNPHAGEAGELGDEEDRLIEPAISAARDADIDARGPFAADTVFNRAVRGEFDLVVAMYHDQGLIPVKLLAWEEAVNLSVGLPIVRTSPDHGTAFDIAGRNVADPRSTIAAIRLALRLCCPNHAAARRRA